MSVSPEQIAQVQDLFADLGAITMRRMMGGATFYADGAIFAILDAQGVLYLRSKGALAQRLLSEGERMFAWDNPKTGKTQRMGYVTAPEAVWDDPEQACALAREALAEGIG